MYCGPLAFRMEGQGPPSLVPGALSCGHMTAVGGLPPQAGQVRPHRPGNPDGGGVGAVGDDLPAHSQRADGAFQGHRGQPVAVGRDSAPISTAPMRPVGFTLKAMAESGMSTPLSEAS
jgi:hypothetical protein